MDETTATFAAAIIGGMVGWLVARAPAVQRSNRDKAAAFLEGYERGQQNEAATFLEGYERGQQNATRFFEGRSDIKPGDGSV